ncbi:MAG: hypothetical protein Q8M95_14535 [Candidatus Methanoperedens sp.]|nr:hypothetical protein [Candidatus Methanoperedens sp.]
MASDTPWRDFAGKFTWADMLKGLVFNILYLFVLTLVGILIVTAYNYSYPIDVMSEASVLTVALIFMCFVILDFGLLYFNKPTPTLLAILIVISPLFVIYKLVMGSDFIRIDRGTPARLKRYIPLRIV